MTGAELKEFTETLLDGIELEDELFYPLLNVAKTKLEEMNVWQYLKKLNTSLTATSNTAQALPTDFARDLRLLVGPDREYYPISFEEQHLFRNASLRYFIDHAAETLTLLGNVQSNTVYFYYKRFTPDIEETTEPVFPTRFHPLLGFYVTAFYQVGIDADDIFARMAPEQRLAAVELKRAMEAWDSALAVRSQNNRIGVAESENGIPLELM